MVYVHINIISELFTSVGKKSNSVISNCTAAMILSSFCIISNKHCQLRDHSIRFTIKGPSSLCVYLAPLLGYGASNIGRTDMDRERKTEEGKEKEKEEGEGKWKGKGKGGRGKGKGKRKEKEQGKGKGKGRWKEDSLRKVGRTYGRTHARTHGQSGDFILCPMLCITLDRQKRVCKRFFKKFCHKKLKTHF